MSKVESAIKWMENTANNNAHGYDQIYRWGEKGDFDCSSAVITAYEQAGIPLKTNGATYTGNMYSAAMKCGFKDVTSSINLATGAGLVRGDILLNEARHVAMYCGNGMEVEASINEKGGARGGQPGDQTGREFLIRPYRNYPWNKILRYPETPMKNQNAKKGKISVEEAARNVIAGKYGNGDERKKKLKELGLDPDKVQKKVNKLLKS